MIVRLFIKFHTSNKAGSRNLTEGGHRWGEYGGVDPSHRRGSGGPPQEDFFENNTKMVHSDDILGRIPTSKSIV